MIKMISICSANGVIGVNNSLPFSYEDDMKYFRKSTLNSTVIMGRKTFESLKSPLPKRRNIVIASSPIDEVETYTSLKDAIEASSSPIPAVANLDANGVPVPFKTPTTWLIGGASVYEQGMQIASEIHLNIAIKEWIDDRSSIRFPWINPTIFELSKMEQLVPGNDDIIFSLYKRKLLG